MTIRFVCSYLSPKGLEEAPYLLAQAGCLNGHRAKTLPFIWICSYTIANQIYITRVHDTITQYLLTINRKYIKK